MISRTNLTRPMLVAACILGLSVSVSAIQIASFGVLMEPLATSFGWSRGQLSLAFSTAVLAIALASPFVGKLVARFGVRNVLLAGIPSFALAMGTLPFAATSFPAFLAWFALAGTIGAAANTFVYLSVLPGWFPHRLGLVLGIAMTGIGLGQAASPIVTQYLIDRFGWDGAYQGLGLLSLVIALPVVLLFIRDPDRGASRPGRDASSNDIGPGEETIPRWFDRQFSLFGISFFLIAFCASGAAVHMVAILLDKGLTPKQAAAYGATAGVAVLISRLVTGYLLDRVDARLIAAFNCLCAAAAVLLLLDASLLAVAIYAPLFVGMAIGAEGDLMPYCVKRVYGLAGYPQIYSRLFMFFNLGGLLGPLAMGIAFDLRGSYDVTLLLGAMASVLAFLSFLGAMRPARASGMAIQQTI